MHKTRNSFTIIDELIRGNVHILLDGHCLFSAIGHNRASVMHMYLRSPLSFTLETVQKYHSSSHGEDRMHLELRKDHFPFIN